MRIQILSVLTAAMLLSACGASVNPVLQRRVVESFNKSSSTVYDASSAYTKPMPYAVGQYVTHGTTDGDKRMIVRTALVGRDGETWIMETSTLSESSETMMQMAVSGMEKVGESMDIDDLDIKWIRLRNEDGEVQKIDGMALSMMKGSYSKMLTGIAMQFTAELSTATVRVPAGTFNGCTKAISKVETFFGDYEAEAQLHPKVPLNGLVRSVSKDDGTTTELLDFGTNAKAGF